MQYEINKLCPKEVFKFPRFTIALKYNDHAHNQ